MSIKVLVADDSITIQKVIGIIFGGDEYSLTVVDNGKAAVDKAREINPDILLIDALMPGMTGYEVAEAVRATPALSNKPILLLTGSFEPFDEEKAKKCGADSFISKPFESQQIIASVKELLALGRSRDNTVQTAQAEHAPLLSAETQTPENSIPAFDTSVPAFDNTQSPAQQPVEPADIWGAFTPEVERPVEPIAAPVFTETAVESVAPNVFAMVSEESDAELLASAVSPELVPNHTGSQWVPVEENTFEFEEETAEEASQPISSEQPPALQEVAFGDISFEEETSSLPATPAITEVTAEDITPPPPVFAEISATTSEIAEPPVFSEPVAPQAPETGVQVVAATASPVTLTEEQLIAAVTSASKEVIERIVWEVVPDLADAMIRDAIRKIKEGI